MSRLAPAHRPLVALAASLLLALGLVTATTAVPAGAAGDPQVFTAPFEAGPTAGDEWNYVDVDTEGGSITILRAYPIPGAINCPGKSGMATFRIPADGLLAETVTATFSEALMDGYTFITLTVRDDVGDYLAANELRGPLLEGGTVSVDLPPAPADAESRPLTIDIGLKVASACPMIDGGTVTVSTVEVS